MRPYALSIGAGILVGFIYGLLRVRSPAPPVVALVGLLGILIGEQLVPIVRQAFGTAPIDVARLRNDCSNHILGSLPQRADTGDASAPRLESER